MRVRVLVWVAVLAVCSTGAIASASTTTHLTGTWSGKYSGTFSGTFRLRWRESGSQLRGMIKLSPGGTFPITGKVRGNAITFGTVGGVTYTGKVSGSSMSGKYKTPQGAGGSWSAHKTS
jgi:hypothetical protein